MPVDSLRASADYRSPSGYPDIHAPAMFKEVIRLGTTTSTMDEAADLIRSNSPKASHGTVVVADQQTLGKGRHGRQWLSDRVGDLLVSFILRPRRALVGSMPILGGLAASLAVDQLTGVESRIKWPNDVLIQGRKVSGVIAESLVQGGETVVVLGIGINLVFEPMPDSQLRVPSANLNEFAAEPIGRDAALDVLCQHVKAGYELLGRGESIIPDWRERLETLGRSVVVTFKSDATAESKHVIRGIAEDVDELGRLMLRGEDGHLVSVAAGEVTVTSRE